MNPLPLIVILLGILLVVAGIKGSYKNISGAVKRILCQSQR